MLVNYKTTVKILSLIHQLGSKLLDKITKATHNQKSKTDKFKITNPFKVISLASISLATKDKITEHQTKTTELNLMKQ